MNYDLKSTRPPGPANVQTADNAVPPQQPSQRMQPPRKGALPYTREEYRALPTEQKNAALDFIIEGIIPGMEPDGNEGDVQIPMQAIVKWCIEHGEDTALEFLFRESGTTREFQFEGTLNRRAVALLRPALQSNPQVRLAFCSLNLEEDAALDLAELIGDGRVTKLEMQCANLGSKAICLIADALRSNTTVTKLVLYDCNTLNEDVAKMLGEALAKNTGIVGLELSRCDFGPRGWSFLLDALEANRHVKDLKLMFCSIASGEPAACLGRWLASTTTLKSFLIWTDAFDRIARDVLDGLGRNRSIEKAEIDANDLVYEHTGQALCDCIARNTVMKELDFVTFIPLNMPNTLVHNTSLLRLSPNLLNLSSPNPFVVEEDGVVARTMQRNAALVEGSLLRRAASVFTEQPSTSASWLPEGPSDVLAEHILKLEHSILDFANTMAHVELAVKEQT
ncbi:leucine-rich repeat domain-containing protein [Noviherbaspirillum pedocola]|uniref:RNI-like protein n=1 Tax=Noviherbaspirillum pedocola TaxID=2801341 RepID=A0A934W7B8_9BURK|nr:hypothetical protein [Noviherbaspirillum pedocola]MBK4737232.1 hypothetical protein [Noviherbaspirillum pedocola]